MSAFDAARIARLTELARKAYPFANDPAGVTVTSGFEGDQPFTAIVWVDGEVAIDLDAGSIHAFDALEAALRVLAGLPPAVQRLTDEERALVKAAELAGDIRHECFRGHGEQMRGLLAIIGRLLGSGEP